MKLKTTAAAFAALIIVAACSGRPSGPSQPRTAVAVFSLQVPANLQQTIQSVEAIVSAADMDTIGKNLTISGDTLATGAIDNIPVGLNRLFTLNVYKVGDILSHTGSTVANVLTDTVQVSIALVPVVGTAIITGIIGQDFALAFDGTDDYAVIENYTFPGELTLEAWFKPASTQLDRGIVGDYFVPGGALLGIAGSDSGGVAVCVINENNIGYAKGTTIPQPDTWYHIAGTYDGQIVKVYVNGNLEGTASQSGPVVTPNGRFQIGGYALLAKHTFHGVIDEVRVWNYARSESQIQANIYTRLLGNEAGLVNYWRLDEGTGQMVADAAGNFPGRLGSTDSGDLKDPVWIVSDRPRRP